MLQFITYEGMAESVVQRGGSIDFDIAAECWLLH